MIVMERFVRSDGIRDKMKVASLTDRLEIFRNLRYVCVDNEHPLLSSCRLGVQVC